jgi:hypothetical protein
MKKTTLFLSALLCGLSATAQPCPLQDSEITQDKFLIYLKPACTHITTKSGWNSRVFITKNKVLAENAKNPMRHLVINQAFYTGFLSIMENESDSLIMLHQYNNGVFERADKARKNTLERMDVVAPISSKGNRDEGNLHLINTLKTSKPQNDSLFIENYKGSELSAKPVLYLYTTQKTNVSVKLNLHNQTLIHPYPAYKNGWNVTAEPNGTIINNETNRAHYCLFWETKGDNLIQKFEQGFVVEGAKTADFLEQKLALLGLTPKEANEFIIFWLPQMENNPYNLIYFAKNEYENACNLDISPKPDALIRIMMVWQPSDKKIDLPEQNITPAPARKGFVAVEWGGQKLSIDRAEQISTAAEEAAADMCICAKPMAELSKEMEKIKDAPDEMMKRMGDFEKIGQEFERCIKIIERKYKDKKDDAAFEEAVKKAMERKCKDVTDLMSKASGKE